MLFDNSCPLTSYFDITTLCPKGHVVLVRNELDEQLYVKKYLQCYSPEVYLQLKAHPIKNTPVIYGIYEEPQDNETGQPQLTVIEEYLPGSTLAEILEEEGVFSEKETLDIAMQLCRILMELHAQKPSIIHRDIKPSNIMRTPQGIIKLLDFNAAKAENASQGRDTVLLGTAGFAAPEQYGFSSSSPQTDIYAVGVLMNVCLTQALPSEKAAAGKLKKVICKCLELNPRDRYQNVRELYLALKRISQVKAEWLPPGFRTLNPLKMIAGLAAYIFIFAVAFAHDVSEFKTPMAYLTYQIGIPVFGILTLCFLCNYLNMQKWFPFMRSPHKWLRAIGYIFNPILIFWVIIVLIVILENIQIGISHV